MRRQFVLLSLLILAADGVLALQNRRAALWILAVAGPILAVGWRDLLQRRHSVRRNFPVIGNFRYFLEAIRPEINQYFVESNTDGVPFNRDHRSLVYQRSKREPDTVPFGTRLDVYQVGYEWLNHSLAPVHVDPAGLRVEVGGPQCTQKYSASIFNISAMSYGSLSKNAVMALNAGAKSASFLHDTGDG